MIPGGRRLTESYRIGVIGTGTIAEAMVEGIACDGHQITVSRRNEAVSASLAARFDTVSVAENQGVLDASDVVFLCLMSDVAAEILPDLRFRPGQIAFSLMVGASLPSLSEMVAPATAEAIVLPFPFIAQGGSPVLVHPSSKVASEILGRGDSVFAVESADDFATLLAAQAVLSPALKLVADAIGWAGERMGNTAVVEGFLRMLVGGTLMSQPAEETGALAGMLEALNTPGGLNATLRAHMDRSGTPESLRTGLDGLEARLKGKR